VNRAIRADAGAKFVISLEETISGH